MESYPLVYAAMESSFETSTDLAAEFPVIARQTWLNHAAISPWPTAVIQAMSDFVAENASQGPVGYANWMATENRLRQLVAQLIGAESEDDVAIVANTSTALNRIAGGLDWRDGDNVVFPANEFPSNRLPWLALARRGVEPRAVDIDPSDPEGSLMAAMDRRSRLLSVSSVQYDTGLRFDIERLGQACQASQTLFCIDAIQHVGALPLAVDQARVDFVTWGSHKWMLAPEGLGLFWSRPQARERLATTDQGWRTFPDPFNFARPDWTPPATARRFETGTLNSAGIHAVTAAVKLLLSHGPQEVGQAIVERTQWLSSHLASMPGIRLTSPRRREQRAGIVSFSLNRLAAPEVCKALRREDIHTAVRGTSVRLSPHFYTPWAQLEQLIRHIEKLV
jgi:cysteine desulfurase / selenocysteine lyase